MQNNAIFEDFHKVINGMMDADNRITKTSALAIIEESVARFMYKYNVGAFDLQRTGDTWMISDMAFEFCGEAYWRDNLKVRIWISEMTALRSYFDIEFQKRCENQTEYTTIGKGFICYSIINMESGRPVRCDEKLSHIPTMNEKVLGSHPKVLISPSEAVIKENIHPIVSSDIDMNLHVSNLVYLESVLDSHESSFLRAHTQKSMKLKFLKQTFSDDTLKVTTYDKGNGLFSYFLSNNEGEQVCRVEILWEESQINRYAFFDGMVR